MLFSGIILRRRQARRPEVVRVRLLMARELLVRFDVPYECIWRLAGFSSRREMERYWNIMFCGCQNEKRRMQ